MNKLKSIISVLKGNCVVLKNEDNIIVNCDVSKAELREMAWKFYRVVYMGC